MSVNYSNITKLVTAAWGVLGKNTNSDGSKRFFNITHFDKNSLVHLLAYYNADWNPQRVFNAAHATNDTGFPFIEVVETRHGDAILTYHGEWRKNSQVQSNIPKKFNLSSNDNKILEEFKTELIKAAKCYLKEFFQHDPDNLYEHFVGKYKKENPNEFSGLSQKFSVSGTVSASFGPVWRVPSITQAVTHVKLRPF